jgi:hypothetical protein
MLASLLHLLVPVDSHISIGGDAAMSYEDSEGPRRPGHRSAFLMGGLSVLALAAATALPSQAMGQTCLGAATAPGQFSLGGTLDLADDARGYGVQSQANPAGRMALGARLGVIDLDDADDNITTASGELAFQLAPRGALSLCPVVGVEHDFWDGEIGGVDLDSSRWAFPAALSVGTRLGGGDGSAVLLPAARVGVMHQRFSGSASSGPFQIRREGDQTDPFLDAGATVKLGPIYGKGGIRRIFEDEGETVFRFGAGFIF